MSDQDDEWADDEWTFADLAEIDPDCAEVKAWRARMAARREKAERERTPGTVEYQERVEAEGQMRLVP